jgi:hypothetical protein
VVLVVLVVLACGVFSSVLRAMLALNPFSLLSSVSY